ncbi:histidine kinase [Pseudonocardia sp.]|uniref:sensor histidine kinase n=1 Tax=Pseudonocardia sp. TaxID=60912 RepID=UPI00260C21F8|nr:histidine kinase [Pseudonocardia sp.]
MGEPRDGRWTPRRVGLELLAVGVPAIVAVLGVPAFEWSVPAALIACAALPLRHVWPPLALIGVLAGLAGGLGWPPALVALYALGRRADSFPEIAPWLVLPVVAAVAPVFATQDLPWPQGVLTVGFVMVNTGAAAVLGLLVGTRSRLVDSLAALDAAREVALAARADAARAEERARIGREIHDAVGHHITLIAVGAAAIAASTRDDDTRRSAEQLRALAKRSLGEVRSALGLDGGSLPAAPAGNEGVVADVGSLVAQWRGAGLEIELADDRRAADLCPVVGRAAYRVVQESLTNAARHAPGAAVRVEVDRGPRALTVRVANTAANRPQDTVAGGGTGLVGLSERVGSLGGRLTAGPRPDGGFAVEAVLPVEATAAV